MKAIFAGTFDPFTSGHLELVRRARDIFGEVIVAVAEDTGKAASNIECRKKIAELSVKGESGVSVVKFDGLLCDFAVSVGNCVFVRGARNTVDFEYEKALSRVYKSQCGVDTCILYSSPDFEHVSSTVVRRLASLGASLDGYVSPSAKKIIIDAYGVCEKE